MNKEGKLLQCSNLDSNYLKQTRYSKRNNRFHSSELVALSDYHTLWATPNYEYLCQQVVGPYTTNFVIYLFFSEFYMNYFMFEECLFM